MSLLNCLAMRAAALLSGVSGVSAAAGARLVLVDAFVVLEDGRAAARTAFKATLGGAFLLVVDALARARAAGVTGFSSGSSRRTSRGSTSSRIPRKTGWRITPSRVHSANLTSAISTGFTQVGFSLAWGRAPLNGGALTTSGFISL